MNPHHDDKCSKFHEFVTPFDSWSPPLMAIKRRGELAIVYILYATHGHAEECLLADAHVHLVSSTS